jgi:ankyrin repeat protein
MSVNISYEDLSEIRKKYSDLINYSAEKIDDPIDIFSYRDSSGDAILHIAAQRGDIDTIKILLAAGLDINMQGDMGYTPLHYAALSKNGEMFDLLQKYGARTDIKDEFGNVPGAEI